MRALFIPLSQRVAPRHCTHRWHCVALRRVPWELLPATLSPDVTDLLHRLLEKDPNARIKVPDIMSHPWVTRHGGEPLTHVKPFTGGAIEVSEAEVSNAVKPLFKLQMATKLKIVLGRKLAAHRATTSSASQDVAATPVPTAAAAPSNAAISPPVAASPPLPPPPALPQTTTQAQPPAAAVQPVATVTQTQPTVHSTGAVMTTNPLQTTPAARAVASSVPASAQADVRQPLVAGQPRKGLLRRLFACMCCK